MVRSSRKLRAVPELAVECWASLYERIIENDCGSLAGCFGRIGLALDQPAIFGPLITDWADEGEDIAPPVLRVVK